MDKLEDGNYVDEDGDLVWVFKGNYHRNDGPAIIYKEGGEEWVNHGQLHRTDGPAIEGPDGYVRWNIYNQQFTFEDWLKANTEISEEEKVMLKLEYG